MTEDEWRGILNQLLYVLEYHPVPDDPAVDAIAENMIERRILPSGPEEYYHAYSQALQSARLLGPQSLPTRHDEASLRDTIARLLFRLDERRPWPQQRFAKLQTAEWTYADAPTTAVLRATRGLVEERIWQVFDYVGVAGARTPVIILRQRTGEIVAMIASTGPRPQDRSTVALRVLHGDPTEALASFMELTGFAAGVVVTPDQEPDAPTSTPLMDPGELELYRLFVHRGRLHRADDASRFDTKYGAVMRSGGSGRAIFVMDSQGNLYASTVELIATFHHSSFLAGNPVAGAGEIVVHNGELAEITGRSPQYPVSEAGLQNVVAALGQQGLDTTNLG
jgi:hypothetical protein